MKPPIRSVLTGPQIEPLTPADADLRHFPDYPVNAMRLRDSDLAGDPDPEAFRLSVLSWLAAWHQVPAGTLPNDLTPLARLLGFGRDTRSCALAIRAGRLRGWLPGTDGRLHHPVVAEVVNRILAKSRGATYRTVAARTARLAKLAGAHNPLENLESDALSQSDDRDCREPPTDSVESERQRLSEPLKERKGREGREESPLSPPNPEAEPAAASPPSLRAIPRRSRRTAEPQEALTFAAFWTAYPRHDARKAALAAYLTATKRTDPDTLRAAAERYAAWATANGKRSDELAHAATWLNGERWTDATIATQSPKPPQSAAAPPEPVHPLWPKLRGRISPTDFNAWIGKLRELERDDREITFAAPSRFVADHARANFAVHLEAALTPLRVRIVALAPAPDA